MFNRLADVLQKEYTVVLKLGEAAENKSDALVKEDISALNALIDVEQSLKDELHDFDLERGKIAEEISAYFGADENMNIDEIIDKSKEPVKSRLLDLKAKLNASCIAIKQVNEINLDLTRLNLNCIDHVVRSFFSMRQSVTYCSMGETNKDISESIFDDKA